MNHSFREDLLWWDTYANKFNGQETILGKFAPIYWIVSAFEDGNNTELYKRFGHHIYSPDPALLHEHINIKEMWAVLGAENKWVNSCRNSSIMFITDADGFKHGKIYFQRNEDNATAVFLDLC